MMQFLSPAKVNLSLDITGKDPVDGYHYINSVFDPVSVYDLLDFEKTSGSGISVMDKNSALNIPPEKNIVYKAAKLFIDTFGIKKGIRIKLYKNIPNGAGLGGGSSNAATTLHAMNLIFKVFTDKKHLAQLACKLGSDVPFFIYNRTAVVSGKGEKLKFITKKRKLWYVLLCKPVHVSTKYAYELFDLRKKLTVKKNNTIIILRYIKGKMGSKPKKGTLLHNDFEDVIFSKFADLKEAKGFLTKCNCIDAGMSGSGATVFAVFETKNEAVACYETIRGVDPRSFSTVAHSI
jgi:4-diphosphocytidyl-2-C-methyl-D-erythritol kinase